MSDHRKFRLLTRSDFDGLVCAILLKDMDILGDIKFVHPKDVQDGKVEVTDNDILTNLPYDVKCHLCFDHHASEELRNGPDEERDNHILIADADSAARVVYEHFGDSARFENVSDAMMTAVDKADMAAFSEEDIVDPQGWDLLSFLMDSRTNLGRFRQFRVSNYQLMMDLIDYCKDHTIEEILEQPDVAERVELYRSHAEKAREQIKCCSTVYDNLVVLDTREEETVFSTNRFTVYALFPECNISIHCLWGRQKQNVVYAIGRSILDRSCTTDVGALCLEFGGGGHEAAGTCQVPHEEAERVKEELIRKINDDAKVSV